MSASQASGWLETRLRPIAPTQTRRRTTADAMTAQMKTVDNGYCWSDVRAMDWDQEVETGRGRGEGRVMGMQHVEVATSKAASGVHRHSAGTGRRSGGRSSCRFLLCRRWCDAGEGSERPVSVCWTREAERSDSCCKRRRRCRERGEDGKTVQRRLTRTSQLGSQNLLSMLRQSLCPLNLLYGQAGAPWRRRIALPVGCRRRDDGRNHRL
jgi:hypothetical protein